MCFSIKKWLIKVGFMAFVFALFPAVVFSQNVQIGDRILAVVNDDVITEGELDKNIKYLQFEGRLPADVNDAIKVQVLKSLVDEYAQLQRAAQVGMSVTSKEKDQVLKNYIRAQKTSLSALRSKLGAKGISVDEYSERLAKGALVQQLVRADVGRSVSVNDDEIINYVKTNNIRASAQAYAFSYVLAPYDKNEGESKAELFEKILSIKSDNTSSSLSGLFEEVQQQGVVASFKKVKLTKQSKIPDLFINALQTIKKGELTKVLEAPLGLYVIQLDEVQGSGFAPEKRKAQHILIEAGSPTEFKLAKNRMAGIRQQILGGESFESLAQYYSDDSGSAAKGGDLGWVERGVMVAPFEKVLFSLDVGELSDPIVTPYGVHLVKLNEVSKEVDAEEEVKAIAYNALMSQKVQQYYPAWLSELVGRAYVRYMQ